jgi:hypothetical protein
MAKKKNKSSAIEAVHGDKMIEVKLRFWTNEIARKPGLIIPKHAWTSGVVRIERNDTHGIKPGAPIPFHSLLDVGTAIQRLLIQQGVVLHTGRVMQKYLTSDLP